MVIFLPIRIRPTGGTSTFARNLQSSISSEGHNIVFSFQHRYDALLVPAVCPLRYLLHAKLFRRPIIHRLDGVYYPTTVAGRWWRWHNLPMIIIRRFFATATIYQSEYSKKCAVNFLGSISHPSQIIFNGVDIKHFSPSGSTKNLRRSPGEKIVITWSRFRRPDQLLPAIKAVENYRHRYNTDIRFIVIGDFDSPLPPDPETLLKTWGYASIPDWLEFLGPILNKDLPKYARGADLFLFTHQNPPCPNNVLEAMACGLPICGIADGAMPEIVHDNQDGLLLSVPGEGYLQPRNINCGKLADQIKIILNQPSAYGASAASHAQETFNINKTMHLYQSFISKQTQQKIRHS
jgi:glycosyltransferase involved in cell wall biosynthesis